MKRRDLLAIANIADAVAIVALLFTLATFLTHLYRSGPGGKRVSLRDPDVLAPAVRP